MKSKKCTNIALINVNIACSKSKTTIYPKSYIKLHLENFMQTFINLIYVYLLNTEFIIFFQVKSIFFINSILYSLLN